MLKYKPILCLFYVLTLIYIIEARTFSPAARLAHSSVLVGTKLYFFGGYAIYYTSDEVFYLDLSEPFGVTAPPWNDVSSSSVMPIKNAWGTTVLVNNKNDSNVYLIGGIMRDREDSEITMSSYTHTFNPNSGQWNVPETKGVEPVRRRNMKAVVDSIGKIHIFCGFTDQLTGSNTSRILYDLTSLNTNDLTWSFEPLINAPIRRDHYTATLLSDGTIVYIGGREFIRNVISEVDIDRINLYNTKKSTWSVMRAKINGRIDSRYLHSAVLAPGDRIIICGGARANSEEENFQVTPDVAVLNTQTNPFEWTIPQVSSDVEEFPPTLIAHTANLVGYYMIVAFGNVTIPNAYPSETNSKIYLLDIRNFTWVNTFEPISAQSPLYSESFNSTSNKTFFTVIGGILGATLVGLIYGWNKWNKKENKLKKQQ